MHSLISVSLEKKAAAPASCRFDIYPPHMNWIDRSPFYPLGYLIFAAFTLLHPE